MYIYIEKKISGVSKMPKMCLRIGPHQNTAGPWIDGQKIGEAPICLLFVNGKYDSDGFLF